MIPSLLLGINTLLPYHSSSPTADCVEILGLGLECLLPLLDVPRGVVEDSGVVIGALCALISLLYGSWPVLSRHVETIVSGLILLIGRSDVALEETQMLVDGRKDQDGRVRAAMVLELALHTASIALVLGKPTSSTRSAPAASTGANVLDIVEEKCLPQLVHRCHEIRERSNTLIQSRS